MRSIFKIFSSENLKKNIKTIWDRFPISVIIVLLVAGLFFAELHYSKEIGDFLNKRIFLVIVSLIMTFVFSIATYLSTENSSKTKLQRNLFQLIPIVFGVIFYNIFSLDINDFENFLFFFLTFSGIIAYLFFAPYLKNIIPPFKGGLGGDLVKQSVFYTYFYNISVIILIGFIFALVLFGLGAIAIAAVDTLFNLDISEKNTYGNWAILSLSLITPLFALTQIPDKKSFLEVNFKQNAFFSFLIKFVAIPFIYIYFFILYAYSIKVLANFGDWPKGEVSWLVIGFSIFGYLIYSFSYIFETPSISPPLKGETSKVNYINIFRKIFPYAVIPQVFMLFYAIYLRIAQYDLTVNRYFVVVFGLWLLVISLHFIFSKKKNLIVLPASLALFIIIISIIPKFNVYNYPEERQLKRLETNLEKAGILKNGKIIPLKNYSDISKDLSKNIYSGIDYLCDFNNCKSIKNLFSKIYSEIEIKDREQWEKRIKEEIKRLEKNKDNKLCEYNKYGYIKNYSKKCFNKKRLEKLKKQKYEGPSKWTIKNRITEKIKVDNYFEGYFPREIPSIQIYEGFYKIFPLDVSKYTEILKITSNIENRDKKYGEIDIYNKKLNIKENGKIIKTIDLKNLFENIIKKYDTKNQKNWGQEDYLFKINKNYDIILTHVNFPRNINDLEKKDDIGYYYFDGLLLVK